MGAQDFGRWVLPGYEIGPVLGRGGFSTVYRARQLSLGRDVAVKVLTTDLAGEGDRRRFNREREAMVRLSPHQYVVDVIDAGVTPERRPFLVMRLYPGGTLADRLSRQGRLPVAEVVDLVSKLASALDASHAIGVLHRDVKPQNVLLAETGEPVLVDFGIAGIVNADRDRDRSHRSTQCFTLAHAAPEILEHGRYSVVSDVYSLASTTYELLTGRPAFNPQNPRSGALILDTPPPPISLREVPIPIADAVVAAMAKKPADRPVTAGAFAATLISLIPDTPAIPCSTVVRPDNPPTVQAPRRVDEHPEDHRGRTRTRTIKVWVIIAAVASMAALTVHNPFTRGTDHVIAPETAPTSTPATTSGVPRVTATARR